MTLKPQKLDLEYDETSDVLYISLGRPREADDTTEPQDGVIIRSRKGEVVGITIINLKKKMHDP